MPTQIGFDNQKYLEAQSAHILERISQFGGKLYLEFGGKLFDDHHAARVLPGFAPDSKIRMLLELKDQAEIVLAVGAPAIEQNKLRSDLGITYGEEVLRLCDAFQSRGLSVSGVVITQYTGQATADAYKSHLESLGIQVYLHHVIPGYPHDISHVVSPEGFGKNDYIETSRPLVVITGPGPGSGKMATCLSQLYHENLRGVQAGYAKYETFPIWNLSLQNPVNLAYEAATADLNDMNMIDPFHLQAYGTTAVNYNRDIEIFPVLKSILETITGASPYQSPTDMGVNQAGFCIVSDEAVRAAACQEIIRRYYAALCDRQCGQGSDETVFKLQLLMKKAGITDQIRPVISAANRLSEETGAPAAAIELHNGTIITGKTSDLMGSAAAALLNALKALSGMDPQRHLISRMAIEPIQNIKVRHLGSQNPRLHSDEILIALAISAASDPEAARALESLDELRDCEAHSSVILSSSDSSTYSKLGLRLTCTPQYQNNQFFHKK